MRHCDSFFDLFFYLILHSRFLELIVYLFHALEDLFIFEKMFTLVRCCRSF